MKRARERSSSYDTFHVVTSGEKWFDRWLEKVEQARASYAVRGGEISINKSIQVTDYCDYAKETASRKERLTRTPPRVRQSNRDKQRPAVLCKGIRWKKTKGAWDGKQKEGKKWLWPSCPLTHPEFRAAKLVHSNRLIFHNDTFKIHRRRRRRRIKLAFAYCTQ